MQIRYIPNPNATSVSPLRKILALLITVAVLALVLMFSAVLLVVVVVVGTLAWGWLWWKTRALRKHLREAMRQGVAREAKMQASNDDVFEGEVIRVVESKDE
jgi:ABC-type bacteriocin/lantibiotic exporter with double-glycine peptidase domain